jgi:protein SCO1
MAKLINFIPNVRLMDENGKEQFFHDIVREKTVILNMFYSNCQIKCVPLGRLLKRVNLLLRDHIEKDDIVFVSITLDAENDTVDDLNRFKSFVHTSECKNWHFYTGDFQQLEQLRHKIGMYSPEPEIDAIKSNHSGNFMIFNTDTGFVKHTDSFDNPIDISRKVIQMVTKNFMRHSYDLNDLNYDALTDDELFENIQSMNSMFTVPFLPSKIREKYDVYGEIQRGFQYLPPIPRNETDAPSCSSCCCKNKVSAS